MTKRQLNRAQVLIAYRMLFAAIELAALSLTFDRLVGDGDKDAALDLEEAFNGLWSLQDDLEEEARDNERAYRQRGWTNQDHYQWELACNNVD